ncbi:MAG TPA: VOC family protein [Acidobacteriaceae bacterium]|nr:VOC family protein [Acidobacteriaceae bacterium]
MNLSAKTLITPFLWFDQNAEEGADFYVSIFPNSRRLGELKSNLDNPNLPPKGKPVTVSFELDGLRFTALNGGPAHKFNEAVSFVVACETQAEIDSYWEKLTANGGQEIACSWLKDKFGLCWQIVPANIGELLSKPKAMQAMMQMKKLDIAQLEAAGKE